MTVLLVVAVLVIFVLLVVLDQVGRRIKELKSRIDELAPPQITIRTDIHRHDFQPIDDNRGTACSCGLSHIHQFVGPGGEPDDGRLARCILDACGRWFEDEEASA